MPWHRGQNYDEGVACIDSWQHWSNSIPNYTAWVHPWMPELVDSYWRGCMTGSWQLFLAVYYSKWAEAIVNLEAMNPQELAEERKRFTDMHQANDWTAKPGHRSNYFHVLAIPPDAQNLGVILDRRRFILDHALTVHEER